MKTEHTPGPWDLHFGTLIIEGPEGEPIARACKAPTSNTNMEANARLIAAAPELLEALEAIMFCNPKGVDKYVTDGAKRAIQKAKGL